MSTPSRLSEETVKAAQDIRQAVAGHDSALGKAIATLDSYAIELGGWHLSLWSALVACMVLAGVVVVARVASRLVHRALGRISPLDQTQRLLAEKLVTIAVWLLAILVGIDFLGIDLTALTVFSGAFGLAVGFGLQKTLGNLIAGIILLMDRSIKPGDTIGINDGVSNTVGQIRRIGIRAVSVITRDRKEYLIPNENLMINQVENWSYSSPEVRVRIPVGIAYSSDMELAERLMRQAAEETPRVLAEPPIAVLMTGFGENAVNFEIRVWIADPAEGISNVRSEVLKRVWRLFREHGIAIPFPQRDLNLRDSAALRDLLDALRDHAPDRR